MSPLIRRARAVPIFAAAAALVAVAACDTFLGEDDEVPLPGERIPVLAVDEAVEPDPEAVARRILLPRPYVNQAWPQAGGYPTHAMYHLAVGTGLVRDWSVSVGDGLSSSRALLASPIVAAGRIFTMDSEGRVSAFDERDGRRLWAYNITPREEADSSQGGGIAYDSGYIVVTTGFAQVIALRAVDGALLWRTPVSGPMRGAPTIAGGRVFALTLDNRLAALDLPTGALVWEHSSDAEVATLLGDANPASDGEVVIVPYSNGEVFALDVETGRILWQDSVVAVRAAGSLSGVNDIRARPVIDRDMVLVMGISDRIVALDRLSGARLWEREIGGLNQPWTAGDWIFVLTESAELVALSRDRGLVRWVRALPRFEDEEDRRGRIVWQGPILASDRLIMVGSHGEAWSFSPYDGELRGALSLSDGIPVPPITANGTLYVLENDGTLAAFR